MEEDINNLRTYYQELNKLNMEKLGIYQNLQLGQFEGLRVLLESGNYTQQEVQSYICLLYTSLREKIYHKNTWGGEVVI